MELLAHASTSAKMDEKEKSYDFAPSTVSFRRLSVLQGHLKSGSPRATQVNASPCSGRTKVAVQSSAPMSSKVAEVQKAFPRQRLVDNLSSTLGCESLFLITTANLYS